MFKILSIYEANLLVERYPKKFNVISVERTCFVKPELCQNHLHLKLDDIEDKDIKKFHVQLQEKGMVYPEKQHVIDAITFARLHDVHIIHCHAGIARSTAIGYALYRSRGYTKTEAMAMVFVQNPYAAPNMRLVQFADELLGE